MKISLGIADVEPLRDTLILDSKGALEEEVMVHSHPGNMYDLFRYELLREMAEA